MGQRFRRRNELSASSIATFGSTNDEGLNNHELNSNDCFLHSSFLSTGDGLSDFGGEEAITYDWATKKLPVKNENNLIHYFVQTFV